MANSGKVLYIGDGAAYGPARYLIGVLAFSQIKYFHLPTHARLTTSLLEHHKPSLVVLSDYPFSHFRKGVASRILDLVEGGMGLLMVGGWSSFTGVDGCYGGTQIEQALPVTCHPDDDRMQWHGGFAVKRSPRVTKSHPIFRGVQFYPAPVVAGLNRVHVKKGADCLLDAHAVRIRKDSVEVEKKGHPLLVTGKYGEGRTAALTTDLAPH